MAIKGRGAQLNTHNRFHSQKVVQEHIEGLDEEAGFESKTSFLTISPKSIINTVESPDIPAPYSMNPYQGCEHGCIYCYARNSHEYWGYSAGLDFEQKILVKKNAAELLRKELSAKNYKPDVILMSGNTDCYQPCEKKFGITRSLLEVCLQFKQPVGIITKNTLVERDIDLLQQLANEGLAQVILSVTTFDEHLRRALEPRTATAQRRLECIRTLTDAGIPVSVLMAPVIPALNSMEILDVAERCSEAGALAFGHQVLRLNGQLLEIFKDWTRHHYPDRAEKIIHQTEELHGGKVNDNRFGTRMKGEGVIAQQIADMVKLAKRKYFSGKKAPEFNLNLFDKHAADPQTRLF